MIQIIPAVPQDAYDVAASLRPSDAREVLRSGGYAPLDACLRSIEASWYRYAAVENGKAIALFGVAQHPQADAGVIWMLGTPRAEALQYRFGRESRRFIQRAAKLWPLLYNYVDADNATTRKWLKWLGFEEGEPVPEFGVGRTPFIPFSYRRDSHV